MCVYLYMHNKYTQYTHIMQTKTFILDVINRHMTLTLVHRQIVLHARCHCNRNDSSDTAIPSLHTTKT